MRKTRWTTPAALLALLVASNVAPAADDDKLKFDDLPKAVKKAVKEKFPDAKIRGASKEKDDDGDTIYEVEMTVDGKSIDIIIDDEGEIEATEKEIEVEDLPRAVIRSAKAKFSGAKIEKVEEITDEDDVVVYEIAFSSKSEKSFEVVMSPNGKILEGDDDEKGDKGGGKKKEKEDDDQKGKKGDKGDDDDKKEKKPKA